MTERILRTLEFLLLLGLAIAGSMVITTLAMATTASAADVEETRPVEVFVQSEISVSGENVTLGDVFDNVIENADAAVATAPAPGATTALSAHRIAAIADRYNLVWANADRLARVVVNRTSDVITADTILPALKTALADAGGPLEADIALADNNLRLHVAEGHTGQLRIDQVQYDHRTGSFTAMLTLADDADNPKSRPLQGRAYPVRTVPVLATYKEAGALIGTDDIAWQEVRAHQVGRNAITSVADLVGTQTKRPMEPGRPIRSTDVQKPVMLPKDNAVTIYYQIPGMTLTVKGRAMENGAYQETVRVLNTRSNRTVFAQIIGPNEVVVASASIPSTPLPTTPLATGAAYR